MANEIAQGQKVDKNGKVHSPRWAYVGCYLLILVSFCSHVFTLDRYPWRNADEPYFYYPAVRALEGHGLTYKVRADMPHADTVFVLHDAFFPRTQLAAFWLLGISQFACRLTPFLAAHLAILMLCQFLLRGGLFRSALILSLAWLGDRAHYHVLFGRPEGVCLFVEAAAFIVLVKAATASSRIAAFFGGLLLGIGVGFHPVTASFAVCACIILPLLFPRGKFAALACLVGGGLVALGLILLCWLPHFTASFEQYRWMLGSVGDYYPGVTVLGRCEGMIAALGLGRYWFLALLLATFLLLVPLALFARNRVVLATGGATLPRNVFLLATAFAVAAVLGVLLLLGVQLTTYYVVYFTVWPVIALAVYAETVGLKGKFRLAFYGLGVVFLACWLPSLRHNAYHVRESIVNYRLLDPSRVAKPLAEAVPKGVPVTGSLELFFLARDAGMDVTPMPWFADSAVVPPDTYILLAVSDNPVGPPKVDPKNLAARPVLLEGSLAPDTTLRWSRYRLYGPMESRTTADASEKN
jgi:hypothetical protein